MVLLRLPHVLSEKLNVAVADVSCDLASCVPMQIFKLGILH